MKNYQVALQSIIDSYDAFYIENKWGNDGTHKKEFELLETLASPDNDIKNVLAWIKDNYDCYYKETIPFDSYTVIKAVLYFSYLKVLIEGVNKNE